MLFQLSMFLAFYTPWFWFAIAVICAVIEGLTLGLTTVWFALSAVLHAKREKTNADSLIGIKAVVLQTITEWEKGQVKINGAVWTAASVDGAVIPAGDECIIEKIEGVTLIVKETDASENETCRDTQI